MSFAPLFRWNLVAISVLGLRVTNRSKGCSSIILMASKMMVRPLPILSDHTVYATTIGPISQDNNCSSVWGTLSRYTVQRKASSFRWYICRPGVSLSIPLMWGRTGSFFLYISASCTEVTSSNILVWCGGADRDRTCCLFRARESLSQMSYGPTGAPKRSWTFIVGLEDRCSIHWTIGALLFSLLTYSIQEKAPNVKRKIIDKPQSKDCPANIRMDHKCNFHYYSVGFDN